MKNQNIYIYTKCITLSIYILHICTAIKFIIIYIYIYITIKYINEQHWLPF